MSLHLSLSWFLRFLLSLFFLIFTINLHADEDKNKKSSTSPQAQIEILNDEAYESLFDAVFENPSDLQLNFDLIKAQIARGNKKGAIGSLERVLMLDPDSYLAKILLAELKISLNNFSETTALLNEVIEDPNAPAAYKEKAKELIQLADRSIRSYRFFGSLEAGMGRVSNLRGASINNLVQYYNDYILSASTIKKPESYTYDQVLAGMEYKLATQTPQTLSAVLFNNRKMFTHDDVKTYDLNSKGLSFSYQYSEERVLSLSSTYMMMDLHDENFLNYSSLDTLWIEPINAWLSFKATAGAAYMHYQPYSTISDNTINTGITTQYSLAPILTLPFDLQVTPSIKEVHKKAREDYRASETDEIGLNISLRKSFGVININQIHRDTKYDAAETIYANYSRIDKEDMTSVNMLLNIGYFVPYNADMMNAMKFLIEGTQSKIQSNVLNFNRENHEVRIGLRYEF